ncbi:MAG: Cystathionine gamma-lyase [Planctomycetes bacterium]|nr:Cystathionine gamma-lyase [Planctomycetota bacterium]
MNEEHARDVRLDTLAAHGLRAPGPETLPDGERSTPAAEPIYQTATFDFPSIGASEGPLAVRGGYAYARYGHPNARSLELTIAALERCDDAVATSTGTSAVLGAILAVAGAGDSIAVQRDAYGGTLSLVRTDLARLGIRAVEVDAYDPAALAAAMDARPKALLVESLSNPLVREVDVALCARIAHDRGAALIVDNTFPTPILRRPAEQGADLVVHSATKFLGGHHDVCLGLAAGRADLIAALRGSARRMGYTAPPFDAWLCLRGMKTLAIRMERGSSNASAIAAWLRARSAEGRIGAVHHPGWGALVSFDAGTREQAERVVGRARLIALAPSLGGVATTMSHSATASHRALDPAARRAMGISDGLLRISAGIEAAEDLIADLAAAIG